MKKKDILLSLPLLIQPPPPPQPSAYCFSSPDLLRSAPRFLYPSRYLGTLCAQDFIIFMVTPFLRLSWHGSSYIRHSSVELHTHIWIAMPIRGIHIWTNTSFKQWAHMHMLYMFGGMCIPVARKLRCISINCNLCFHQGTICCMSYTSLCSSTLSAIKWRQNAKMHL